MTDDQKSIALQQLANIVIDAYTHRDEQFIPQFKPGTTGILYLRRPKDDKDHPKLQLNYFYSRGDYEPEDHS